MIPHFVREYDSRFARNVLLRRMCSASRTLAGGYHIATAGSITSERSDHI